MPNKPKGRNVPPQAKGFIERRDKSYKGERVRLDGHAFYNCTFDHCILEIAGTDLFALVGNSMTYCSWEVVGAARVTLNVLHNLYQGLGPVGVDLVEKTFENIRHGGQFTPVISA